MITSQQSLDMETMFRETSRYVTYTMLRAWTQSFLGIKAMVRIRHIFLDGYGVLDVRTTLFDVYHWETLLITHQGNSQVKDNKIDLLVQQYEQFTIPKKESIDNAFAKFNTIITSLKALDEGFSSKNYVWKFLRALHLKWRVKFTTIEESKDLTSLSLDVLIGNLKIYDVIIKKDSKIVKGKREQSRPLALNAKKESSDEEKKSFQRSQDDKNGKSERKCFRCRDLNHLIGECSKPPRNKNQRAFAGGSWRDSGEDEEEKIKDKTCLMAQVSNEVLYETELYSDDLPSIDDSELDSEYRRLCNMGLKSHI
ncbi:zf-CCHC domain-containing protein [Tanacetum coccineum]